MHTKREDTQHFFLVDHRTEWGQAYNKASIDKLHSLVSTTSVDAVGDMGWATFEPLKGPLRTLLHRTFNIRQIHFNSHDDGSLDDSYTTIDVGDALEDTVRLTKPMQIRNFGQNQTAVPVSVWHKGLAMAHVAG